MRHCAHRILRGTSWGLCIAAFAAALLLLVLRVLGLQTFHVVSGSMEPAIPTGSLIVVSTRDRDPEPGEIITYRLESGPCVVHRVVRKEDGVCITKGDANEVEDLNPVTPEQIVGRCIFHVPLLGRPFLLLQQHPPLLFASLCAIVLLSLLPGGRKPDPGKESHP